MTRRSSKNNPERYTQVLLEDLNAQFRTFGEGLKTVDRKITETNRHLMKFERRVDADSGLLRKEMRLVREQIMGLKIFIASKADAARVQALESRVRHIEAVLSAAR